MTLALGLVTTACSGGGGSPRALDDLDITPGEMVVQFEGAGKARLGGTMAMPSRTANQPVGGVLIVPTVLGSDRNGYIDAIPPDPVYQDVSQAVTDAGMAAFRYDRRGAGSSKLEPGQEVTFDDMVSDARNALTYLSQRKGVDPSSLAVVGHDMGGVVAMRVAATDDRVKAVVLLSTPGRPLADVLAEQFAAAHGPESGAAFRQVVADLKATGSLPDRSTLRPEHQSVLPAGQDALLRAAFSIDPAADAAGVKVPTLVVTGKQSSAVGAADAARLAQALGAAEVFEAGSSSTLQNVKAAAPRPFDADDHNSHGGGRPGDTATRDAGALERVTTYLSSKLKASRQ